MRVFPDGVVTWILPPRRAWDRCTSWAREISLPSMVIPSGVTGLDLIYRLPVAPPLGLVSPLPVSRIFFPRVSPLGIVTSMALAVPPWLMVMVFFVPLMSSSMVRGSSYCRSLPRTGACRLPQPPPALWENGFPPMLENPPLERPRPPPPPKPNSFRISPMSKFLKISSWENRCWKSADP